MFIIMSSTHRILMQDLKFKYILDTNLFPVIVMRQNKIYCVNLKPECDRIIPYPDMM